MQKHWIEIIEAQLLPNLQIASERPYDPIVVYSVPEPWQLVGAGNYAAVLMHPSYPDMVVKVYAPGRPGIEDEKEIYRRLGKHPAFSECLHAGDTYLALRRLTGVTLYQSLLRGIPIKRQVLNDIDEALKYAVSQGLKPHDVHGKNVMQHNGRGLVVDVSDFLKEDDCSMWDDLKRAYDRFYFPWLRRIPLPEFLLHLVRRGYRKYRRWARPSGELHKKGM
ncbi:hypothetical protein PAECIP111891_06094 [Paenibacillus allorhizoplanae]|uniref:Serine/threonine protein kinase n=1 Tax=Paenibacillus allorhizoplanae TaxID=2905648 RepID=A0ABN8H3S9_9BACL|nr:serine/threonine protein kinase [Paenibacillus allorhizoplanae]CAH1227202.1 hypothetical protein PAECIP111891_06094 [Paenibacillus allorhizoplanae]